MDADGDQKNKILKTKGKKIKHLKRWGIDVSSIFQSIWIRRSSIFSNIMDRKFMESELRFVLYCGGILWAIYLLYEIVK